MPTVNFHYPIGTGTAFQHEPFVRLITDQFESGGQGRRAPWPAGFSRGRWTLDHSQLLQGEADQLSAFYGARTGGLQSFWYRDNLFRTGNHEVTFASAPKWQGSPHPTGATVELQEVAPRRILPNPNDVVELGIPRPLIWIDANRQTVLQDLGKLRTVTDLHDNGAPYRAFTSPKLTWQAGGTDLAATLQEAYNAQNFDGIDWARGASPTEITGATPGCTLFIIERRSATTTKQVLFAIGTTSAGNALGIAINASGQIEPWIGGTETWTGAQSGNSPVETWRSHAIMWPAGVNTATYYLNAALVGTATNTRSYVAGHYSYGAAPNGSLIANPGNAMARCQVAHAIMIPAALTLAQTKSLHNLLAYQYGLAIVP